MNVTLQTVTLVVLSASNNPRLLNADFLKRNGIVPEDWAVADTLVTSPVAQVTFENGLQIVVEENRLHCGASRLDQIDWQTVLPGCAVAYLSLLPHVSYGGVGLNFVYSGEPPDGGDAAALMIGGLLRPGDWMNGQGGVSGAAVELQYRNRQPQMNVKISVVGAAGADGQESKRLMFNVNFHHDFRPEAQALREAYIRSLPERQAAIRAFLDTLPF